jgi:hypothetical protein
MRAGASALETLGRRGSGEQSSAPGFGSASSSERSAERFWCLKTSLPRVRPARRAAPSQICASRRPTRPTCSATPLSVPNIRSTRWHFDGFLFGRIRVSEGLRAPPTAPVDRGRALRCQVRVRATAPPLSRVQHTELVAIGIGHDHPVDIALTDVDTSRAKGTQAIYLPALITLVRTDVEMKPVLCQLRRNRRTPGNERAGTVRRADRGFVVLIPDQRPPERFTPEVPDFSRTIARDRSQPPAVGEE